MTKNTGGPAFPCEIKPSAQGLAHGERATVITGLSIRDYFAAQALNGVIAGFMADGSHLTKESPLQFAAAAYGIADAMLAARGAK